MANIGDIDQDRTTIRLRHKVRSVYTQKEGTVVQINGNGYTAAVKWDDGSITLAPVASLLKIGGDAASECKTYVTGTKNPYKNMVSKIKQKQSSKFREDIMDTDADSEHQIVYSQYASLDDFTEKTLSTK